MNRHLKSMKRSLSVVYSILNKLFQFSVGLSTAEKSIIIKSSNWNGIIMQVF